MTSCKSVMLLALTLFLSLAGCGDKGKTPEAIIQEKLAEHIRLTNEVFYEKGTQSGKPTSIRIVSPVTVIVEKGGAKALTDTDVEINYINEGKREKLPLKIEWELENNNWAADKVYPEDMGFIISFNAETLSKIKKGSSKH